MKTSVLIIAHNEEKYIAQCIESVLNQTESADEVVLIVHNSTDRTEAIARTYPITVVPYAGPAGIIYARIEGLRHVIGDIIICTDGDSYVARNWCAVMKRTLMNGNILVGSWMKQEGNVFAWISSIFNKYNCIRPAKVERWIWGPSMAFWGKDREAVRDIFEQTISLSKELKLSRNPDDLWLALFMKQRGVLQMTNETHVTQHPKEVSSIDTIRRNRENMRNATGIEAYFEKNHRA